MLIKKGGRGLLASICVSYCYFFPGDGKTSLIPLVVKDGKIIITRVPIIIIVPGC